MSNNWVVENLENALETWNEKLSEIWRLLSESPTEFKGGGIWNVMVNINDALKAVGYALLVLFFLMGIMKRRTNEYLSAEKENGRTGCRSHER